MEGHRVIRYERWAEGAKGKDDKNRLSGLGLLIPA